MKSEMFQTEKLYVSFSCHPESKHSVRISVVTLNNSVRPNLLSSSGPGPGQVRSGEGQVKVR